MAKMSGKSGLSGKLGARLNKAVEEAKVKEIDYGNMGDLPPGVSGIAQLVECKFGQIAQGKTNAGEYFFYAAGVVVEPETFVDDKMNEWKTAGMRTSIIETLCNTTTQAGKETSMEEHIAKMVNELRKLGVDGADLDGENIELTAAALREAKPYFRFRTWTSKPTPEFPNPRVNHTWNGACEYEPGDPDAVEDDTPIAPMPPPSKVAPRAVASAPKTQAKASTGGNGKTPPPSKKAPPKAPEPEPEGEKFTEFGDLDSLAEAADGGDDDAQHQLTEAAQKLGIEESDIEAAASWAALVEMIEAADGEGAAVADSNGFVPDKGDVYMFSPTDPKTKRKGKLIECEVVTVDESAETVLLRNLDNKKITYKEVPFAELSAAT